MKVETYSNWCDIDCYGEPNRPKGCCSPTNMIEHNDKVEITWPSGKKEVKHVLVVKSTRTVSDMGTPYDMPVQKAHVLINHEGAELVICLAGSNIQIEKVKP